MFCCDPPLSTAIQPLIDLANNSRSLAGIQAKNTLNTCFGYDYFDEPILPDPGSSRNQSGAKSEQPTNQVYAFPNPTDGMVQFHYQLGRLYANLSIKIYDVKGVLVDEFEVANHPEGFASWDSRKVKAGFYVYSICSNGQPIVSDKLIVSR